MPFYKTRDTLGDAKWFVNDRFGMFIHFGLYSLAARHEWLMTNECMTAQEYQRYFECFSPDMFEPAEWARKARKAGMRYAVMTAKHHDGFCLFDSQYTEYKVTNTPYGRDIIREYAEAFRAEGIRVGLYYSLIDWNHPDFTIDVHHPRRNDPQEVIEAYNQTCDMHRYTEYMQKQVKELLTNYGKIDIMWFDFSYDNERHMIPEKPYLRGKGKDDWEAEQLLKTVRDLQPDILIDNRTGVEADIWTPEQHQPTEWATHPVTGEKLVWEACQTFSGSWGYHRDEQTWKSPEMLIGMLIHTVSLGGNLIMNVGPTGRGYFDERAERALETYEKWMKYNSRSIYGCTQAEEDWESPRGCCLTQSQDGKRLYIHLLEYPFAYLELRGMAGKVKYAQFLHDYSEVQMIEGDVPYMNTSISYGEKLLLLKLPPVKPNVIVPVIELILK